MISRICCKNFPEGYTGEMNKQWIVIRRSDDTELLRDYKKLSQACK